MRTQRKPLGAKGENQQQIKLNPRLPLMPGLNTVTLVGGKCCHHCKKTIIIL